MKNGIDVSYAQGSIDFTQIDRNQVQFVIIRSSFGWEDNQKDDQFERNYSGFKNLGIPVGAYHYSYAKTKEQAIKEAKYCLECIKGKSFELPVFIDMEEQSCALAGKRACTDVAKAFISTMENAGYASGIYTNPNWLENYLYKEEIVGKVNLWLAQWESSKPYCNCMIWQYKVGKAGSIKGVSGYIDMNYYMDDAPMMESVDEQNDLTDKNKFLRTARSYIGKNGHYICITKLGLNKVYDWCAFAISAIMNDCGFIGKYTGGVHSFASDEAREGDGKYGTFFLKGSKVPQSGDFIMYRYNDLSPIDKYSASHVGIVEKVEGDLLTTLEGNVDGSEKNWAETSTFRRKTVNLNNSSVYSFFRPNWGGASVSNIESSKMKTVEDLANEVIAGKWGAGDSRKNRLTNAGYDYTAVQNKVNEKLLGPRQQSKSTEAIAKEVIAGKWGSGEERKRKLAAAGYDYTTVQLLVNTMMAHKSVDTVAREVIEGKWGSGEERRNRLLEAGYNYSVIQNRVNQLMK